MRYERARQKTRRKKRVTNENTNYERILVENTHEKINLLSKWHPILIIMIEPLFYVVTNTKGSLEMYNSGLKLKDTSMLKFQKKILRG